MKKAAQRTFTSGKKNGRLFFRDVVDGKAAHSTFSSGKKNGRLFFEMS